MSHLLVVLSNAMPDHEDEFNEWYDSVHVHEMVDVDGFESAQRFVHAGTPEPGLAMQPPYKYLALYEVTDLELARSQLRLQQEERLDATTAGREPRIAAPRGMAADALAGFFTTLGPRVTPEGCIDPAPDTTRTTHER